MVEDKINPMEVHHRSQHREQTGAAPRGEQTDTNPNFPPRRQQHTHFNERLQQEIFPPQVSFTWI